MSLPDFKLLRPRSLAEAVELLGQYADAQIVAGGTDLIPSMKQRLFTPAHMIDIRRIAELRGVRSVPGQGTEIGALTTLTEIEHSDLI
ncbi:MAG: FAD binding domain-containing protein, partial [Terriglobales bacterium]